MLHRQLITTERDNFEGADARNFQTCVGPISPTSQRTNGLRTVCAKSPRLAFSVPLLIPITPLAILVFQIGNFRRMAGKLATKFRNADHVIV